MKAISIKQPWAWAIAYGHKTIETRTWYTKYRGPILIVASKLPDKPMLEYLKMETKGVITGQLEYGKAIATAKIVDCRPMTKADEDAALCDTYEKAHSWLLENVEQIKPFDVTGQMGIYEVPMPKYDPADPANYEIEERAAILQFNNPEMHPVHVLNKAKKEIRERRSVSSNQ